MKKVLSIILTICLMLGIGSFNISASAESTTINVYDTQTLETALTTEGADIILWNDISYAGFGEVACHSIDINHSTDPSFPF